MADLSQLEAAMCELSANSTTERIKQAEVFLKQCFKQPAVVSALLQQVQMSTKPAVRQLSAIFLRKIFCNSKRFKSHFGSLSATKQVQARKLLLQRLIEEPERRVRRAISGAVASLARRLLKLKQNAVWQEILTFMSQAANSPNPGHREVAMQLFFFLSEDIGETMVNNFDALRIVFTKCLEDPDSNVQLAALKACGTLISQLSDEETVMDFQSLLVPMMQVTHKALQSGNDDSAIKAFDVFDGLAESSLPLITPHVPSLIRLILTACHDNDVELSVKESAMLIIGSLAMNKPKSLIRSGLVRDCIVASINLLCKVDADEDDVQSCAQVVLDRFATYLPNKHVFDVVIQGALGAVQSSEPIARAGGYTALGAIGEGCAEAFNGNNGNLERLLGQVLQGFSDPEAKVRRSACICLGLWAQHFGDPGIIQYHATILPAVLPFFGNSANDEESLAAGVFLLESISSKIEPEEMKPHVEGLMSQLMGLMNVGSVSTQEHVVSAIATCAVAMETDFLPYFNIVIEMLKQMMATTADEQLQLKSRAIECAGQVAVAVGAEAFAPHLNVCMNHAVNATKIDDPEVEEQAITFFSNLALVLKADFVPYVAQLTPYLLSILSSRDGLHTEVDKSDMGGADFIDDEDEYSDDDDMGGKLRMSVRTANVDKKSAACLCIGEVADNAGSAFQPFAMKSVEQLLLLCAYFHYDVRIASIEALAKIVTSLADVWQIPKPTNGQISPPPEIMVNLLDLVIPAYMELAADDSDKSVVASCVVGLLTVVDRVGAGAVQTYMSEELVPLLNMLLSEKTICQNPEYYDDEYDCKEEEDEQREHDHILVDAVADLVGSLARAYGQQFSSYFQTLSNPLLAFCKSTRPANDRAMGVGAFAEVFDCLGVLSAPYASTIIPLLFGGMSASEAYNMRRNSAYCAGVLCRHLGNTPEMQRHYPAILTSLRPLFQQCPGEDAGVVDNAAGAIARMIEGSPGCASLPLSSILPVLLGAMPLRFDMEENSPVWQCLTNMWSRKDQALVTHLPNLLAICARTLSTDAKEEDKQIVATLARNIVTSGGKEMMKSLSPTEQQALAAALR